MGSVSQVLQSPTQGSNLFALPSPQTLQKPIEPSRVPHILEILKDFFFLFVWKKKHKTAFCDDTEEQNTTKPHPTGNSPAQAGQAVPPLELLLQTGVTRPVGAAGGHSQPGRALAATAAAAAAFQDQTHCTLPSWLSREMLTFTQTWGYWEKQAWLCFLTRLCITAHHHTQMFPSATHHSQEWGSLTPLEEILKSCLF